jgi:hypothetical protein
VAQQQGNLDVGPIVDYADPDDRWGRSLAALAEVSWSGGEESGGSAARAGSEELE